MSAGAVRAGGVFVEIGADPRQFFKVLGNVNGQIGKLGSSMQSAGTKMAALGAGIVGPVFASAAAFASVGSALNDMSKRTGVATESLSVLQFAAEQTGTDMGGVETALKKMQKAIFAAGNGSKEAADALAMVGLSAGDLAGLSADQQIGKIADGLMAIKDPGTRAAVAMQIFGKSGTDILPMLEGGSAGMAAFAAEAKRLGLVMDSDTAAKADALGDAMDAVKASMKMAFIQVGGAVAPMLTSLANALSVAAANVGKFITANQQFVAVALNVGAALGVVGVAVYGVGTALRGLSSGISLVVKGFGLFSALASPVLLVAAGIGAAVFALYKFKDQIGAALGSVSPLVQQAAGAIGQVLGTAVADGMVVLGDLATTATTTFSGIYDAIVAGDLSGAMDILWAGLQAGWLRGVEGLMSYVDPWIASFQDAFTIMGAEIYKSWDALWVTVGNALNTAGAYLLGAFDNIINPILAMWDTLEAGILKSWNYIQSFFKSGFDLQKENQKVDNEMAARSRQRELDRPGIESRAATARKDNMKAEGDLIKRRDAIDASTQDTVAGREDALRQRADQRRADTLAAEAALSDAVNKSKERQAVVAETTGAAAASPSEKAAVAAADAAATDSSKSKAEVAGSFSSANLGGMGFGSTLQERIAQHTKETADGVKKLVGEGGDRVAA